MACSLLPGRSGFGGTDPSSHLGHGREFGNARSLTGDPQGPPRFGRAQEAEVGAISQAMDVPSKHGVAHPVKGSQSDGEIASQEYVYAAPHLVGRTVGEGDG